MDWGYNILTNTAQCYNKKSKGGAHLPETLTSTHAEANPKRSWSVEEYQEYSVERHNT